MPSTSMPRAECRGNQCAIHRSGMPPAPLAMVLRICCVNGIRGMPAFARPLHLVAPCLVRVKNKRAIDRLLLQECASKARSTSDRLNDRGQFVRPSSDRRHRDAGRIAQHLLGEFGDVLWHCRRKTAFAVDRQLRTIFRMSLMKPMSSMRSASSSTRNSTCPSSAVACTRSSRRPGVATMTSTPCMTERT